MLKSLNLSTYSIDVTASARPFVTSRQMAFLLLGADIIGLTLCFSLAWWLRITQLPSYADPAFYSSVLLVLIGLYLADTYHPDRQISGLRAPARVILSNIGISIVIATLLYLTRGLGNNPLFYRGSWLTSLAIFTGWAVTCRILAALWMRSHARQSRWLVLGADRDAQQFAEDFAKRSPLVQLVFLAQQPRQAEQLQQRFNLVGSLEDLPALQSHPWTGVIVADHLNLSDEQEQVLMRMRLQGITVYSLPDFYETFWFKLPSSFLQDAWFVFSSGFNLMSGRIHRKLKRIGDFSVTALLFVVALPLMIGVAIAIKLESRGPVFYSQVRTGLNSQPFRVYKFRSMYQDAEQRGAQWASQRDPRITRVGYWLRLLRIDELPQIWNVLRGEMSLIGPRPERPEFDTQLAQEIPYYNVRYLVQPGISGWAQVMYPYGASIEDAYEKLSYDLYYIKNYSIWLDIAIFFKTIRVVLFGKGSR